MVSFRGQIPLEPRPEWSPLGIFKIAIFRQSSPPLSLAQIFFFVESLTGANNICKQKLVIPHLLPLVSVNRLLRYLIPSVRFSLFYILFIHLFLPSFVLLLFLFRLFLRLTSRFVIEICFCVVCCRYGHSASLLCGRVVVIGGFGECNGKHMRLPGIDILQKVRGMCFSIILSHSSKYHSQTSTLRVR